MLYLGEGAKTKNTVDLANSDPVILRLFVKYLRKICAVDEQKIRVYLYCFENQNTEGLISFWSRTLRIGKDKFIKPYIRKIGASQTRTMKYGVLHIRYNDKRLLEKFLYLCSSIARKLIEN